MSGMNGSHPTIIIGCGTPLGGDEPIKAQVSASGWQQVPLSRWLECLQEDEMVWDLCFLSIWATTYTYLGTQVLT